MNVILVSICCIGIVGAQDFSKLSPQTIASKWRDSLLPVTFVEYSADMSRTINMGQPLANPVHMRERAKINLVSNNYVWTRLEFIEQGIRCFTESWDGDMYIESDRVKIGAKDLSFDSLSDPGIANIHDGRKGSLPELSKLWLDLNGMSYLDVIIEHANISSFDEKTNTIKVGDFLFITLDDQERSVSKIERYIYDQKGARFLSYICELQEYDSNSDKRLPHSVVISTYSDSIILRKDKYKIDYDLESISNPTIKFSGFEVPSGARVNNQITGEQYIKNESVFGGTEEDIQQLNQLIEDAKNAK